MPEDEKAPGAARPGFFDRHPLPGSILLLLWGQLFLQIGGFAVGLLAGEAELMDYAAGWQTAADRLVRVGMAFLALLIHKRWFRPDFSGCLTARRFGAGLLFLAADLAYVLAALLAAPPSSAGLSPGDLALALSAGVTEEVVFRGVPGSYLMRFRREEKMIPRAALLTAGFFAASHAANLLVGADPGATAAQVAGAFGAGVLYAAAFFRTGNLWPCMLAHFFHDAAVFLAAGGGTVRDGVMTGTATGGDIAASLLLGALYTALGLWLLRPAKRAEIRRIWDEKWRTPPETAPTA